MKRILSIDIVRGIVMIIMALDHVRDMMHVNSITQSPTNLVTTSPMLFFTRWVTYLCAPTFVFLAGTSAYLSFRRSHNVSSTRQFLLKRGLYLVLLEFMVVNLGLFFDLGFHTFIFEVIAAIGFGFITLSLLLKLSARFILMCGLLIIFCHNLFSLIPFESGSMVKMILSPLFIPGAFPLLSHAVFIMGYPPIPWLGIMLAGFASGKYFEWPGVKREKLFLIIGGVAILLFFVIRLINIYGDSVPWSYQASGVLTFLSFMNVTKYPPSLLFCLITLGSMFLFLSLSEKVNNKFIHILSVYGKVPLFYFLVHFYLIHFILIAVMFLQGFHGSQLDFTSGTFGRPKGIESGLSLWAIYFIWIGVVMMLYPLCKWYGKYKENHQDKKWLRYL